MSATRKRTRTIRLKGATKVRSHLALLFGKALSKQRLNLGLNHRAVAELCEVAFPRYVEIEEATASTANVSTLDRIAERLRLDWHTMFVKGESV